METTKKPLIKTLQGSTVTPPPIWLMRQAGRYLPEYRAIRQDIGTFLDLCYTPSLAAEVTLQPVRRFAMDGAIIFSDILVIPDALGQPVRFEPGRGPVLEAIASVSDLGSYDEGRVRSHLAPVYEALSTVKAELPSETALIGFAGAPWTVATYMIEGGSSRTFEKIKSIALGTPEIFQALIDLLVEAIATHLIAQVEAGAETVQIFDTWSGVLPEKAFARWCVDPVAEIVRRFKSTYPEVPVIAFPRGAATHYAGFAQATGADALTLDYTVPKEWARDHIAPEICLQGNLDPVLLAAGGDDFESEVREILETFSGRPFVFNLGHGIIPSTPVKHVERLVELVRDHG